VYGASSSMRAAGIGGICSAVRFAGTGKVDSAPCRKKPINRMGATRRNIGTILPPILAGK
jgi:hypothetical protein